LVQIVGFIILYHGLLLGTEMKITSTVLRVGGHVYRRKSRVGYK